MSGIIYAGSVALGIIVLVCGLPMCCYDSYMKSKEAKRREEEYEKAQGRRKMTPSERYGIGLPQQNPSNQELPEKILDFKTAMKDINTNV
tara:strand:+ start:655 stop:924 length:270 start_codon:yes stop_codon:yes gene_type:complete